MISHRNSDAIKDQVKMSQRKKRQIRVEDDGEQEDRLEDVDDLFGTMWTGVPRRTKYESNLGHKAVYNCAILYRMALMMTGPEFSEDLENEQINPWPKGNPMALHKMMMNVWNKWAIDLGRREGQRDKDVANRPTKYKARKVSMRFYEPFLRKIE